MNFNEIKKLNAISTVVCIISGIICYKKYKISNKNIFLFGVISAAVGITSGFYSALFTDLAEKSMSVINSNEEDKADDKI